MFPLIVCAVCLVSLLAALLVGKAGEWSDCDLDAPAVSPAAAVDPVWRPQEEPELWWDDPDWCWPECLRVEEPPGPRLILEQVV